MDGSVSQVRRSKEDARANYNRLSRWYDRIAGSSEEKFRQIGVTTLDMKPGERVLEIGFGTGHCLAGFAHAGGPGGWVCGVDLADGMFEVARKRLDLAGMSEQVGLVLADGANVPFTDSCFDALFMSFTLELFDNPEIPLVLIGCKRVLCPGGRLVIVSLMKQTPPTFAEKIYEWFHNRMPVLVDCRPIMAQTALEEAGFGIERVLMEKMWGLPVAIIAARPG
jgi:ubiquinone/menaquinone biosynthesis C-methylase UbiE